MHRPPLPAALLLDMDDTILGLSASAEVCWHGVCREFDSRFPCGSELSCAR